MQIEDMEKLMRVYILDALVSQSGKQLTPDVIGQVTTELLERLMDIVKKDEFK